MFISCNPFKTFKESYHAPILCVHTNIRTVIFQWPTTISNFYEWLVFGPFLANLSIYKTATTIITKIFVFQAINYYCYVFVVINIKFLILLRLLSKITVITSTKDLIKGFLKHCRFFAKISFCLLTYARSSIRMIKITKKVAAQCHECSASWKRLYFDKVVYVLFYDYTQYLMRLTSPIRPRN